MGTAQIEALKARVKERLTPDEDGWCHYDDHPRDAVGDLRDFVALAERTK